MAALAATGAFAQSSVTISGGLNVGYGSTAGVASFSSNQAAANHVTFTSSEDLGGGLRATASINVRFNPTTGWNISNGGGALVNDPTTTADPDVNDAFAQNVALGLSGPFGQIRLGRFTGVIQAPLGGYDPFGTDTNGVAITPTNIASRANGMISYNTPTINGFTLWVQSTQKNNNLAAEAATAATKNGTEVAVTYAQGPLSVLVGNSNGPTGNKGNAFGASYNLGVAVPRIAYAKTETAAGVETKETMLAVSVPLGAFTLKAGHRTIAISNVTTDVKRTALGVTYALSKRTSILADTHKETGNTTAATNKQAYYLGLRHTF